MEKLVVVGLGLIGGSLALDLKDKCGYKVFGIDKNAEHIKKAIDLGIIESEIKMDEISDASVVIVAVPVDKIPQVLQEVLGVVVPPKHALEVPGEGVAFSGGSGVDHEILREQRREIRILMMWGGW